MLLYVDSIKYHAFVLREHQTSAMTLDISNTIAKLHLSPVIFNDAGPTDVERSTFVGEALCNNGPEWEMFYSMFTGHQMEPKAGLRPAVKLNGP